MKGIVAVDRHWGIGKDGALLYKSKNDMELFKRFTENKVVVMGRKTFDSLPNGEPLKNRMNIVISNTMSLDKDNLFIGDINSVNDKLKEYNTDNIFIIGGSSIYKKFMNRIDTFYVTHIEASRLDTGAIPDTFMPNLIFENFIPDRCLNCKYNNKFWMHVCEWKAAEANGPKAALYCDFLDEDPVCIYSMNLVEWKSIDSNKLDLNWKTKNAIVKSIGTYAVNQPITDTEISQGVWRSEIELSFITNPPNSIRGLRPVPTYIRVCGFGADAVQSAYNLRKSIGVLKNTLLK